jgi:hypothetical protein
MCYTNSHSWTGRNFGQWKLDGLFQQVTCFPMLGGWIFYSIYKCADRNKTDILLIKNKHQWCVKLFFTFLKGSYSFCFKGYNLLLYPNYDLSSSCLLNLSNVTGTITWIAHHSFLPCSIIALSYYTNCNKGCAKRNYGKTCAIWHWTIWRGKLTGNWLRSPLHFTIPSTGITQHQFWEFSPLIIGILLVFFILCIHHVM